jgi:CubicO group peptidase (beta-lactamase class C family)
MYLSPASRIFASSFIAAVLLFIGPVFAQNTKGQIESDKFWDDFSKGFEWLPTSKAVTEAPVASQLEIADDSLSSSMTTLIDGAFDPDVHRIVIVAHKRKIVHRKYNARRVDEKSRPSSASMAKSLTALTVGKALCSGAIKNLDDEAGAYSARLKGTSWGNAKIRHILAMASGSNNPINTPYGSPTTEVQAETLDKSYSGTMTYEFVSLMKKADQKYSESGKQGLYNNLDTIALALLVEDATGEKFLNFFQREIWHASGASQRGTWSYNSHGQVAAFSGFTAHPYDWIRVGIYVLEERAKDTCFGDFLKEATKTQSRVKLPNGSTPYGFQIWVGCGGTDTFCFVGHGGQRVVMSPSTGVVMYMHTTSVSAGLPLLAAYKTIISRYK